ncbi:MAG: response regulator transcription factor [Bacteroidales bacterium]
MIKILLVDDHIIVRKGIKQLLEDSEDIRVVSEAGTAEEMFKIINKQDFDVVILDISLPGRSGVEALKQLKSSFPELPVLILSMHPESQYALRVMKSGAMGYLTKDSVPEELIKAIHKVNKGKKYISTNLAEELANFLNDNIDKLPHQTLTDREYEVLLKIAEGKSLTGIAQTLSLSVKTISTYRSRILKKMNMKSNSELIKYAMEHHLF